MCRLRGTLLSCSIEPPQVRGLFLATAAHWNLALSAAFDNSTMSLRRKSKSQCKYMLTMRASRPGRVRFHARGYIGPYGGYSFIGPLKSQLSGVRVLVL